MKHEVVDQAIRRAIKDAKTRGGEPSLLLAKAVKSDEHLYHLVMEPVVEERCHYLIREFYRGVRSVIWTRRKFDKTSRGGRLRTHAKAELLEFPLPIPGNIRLCDARKPDLVEAIRFYSESADDMAHKARFSRCRA